MFGEQVPVRCNVRKVHGLSAHADQSELLQWIDNLKKAPDTTFITHGEAESAMAFAKLIEEKKGWKTMVPEYLQKDVLFEGI
jgi:metallo-beta-lactamase family protein